MDAPNPKDATCSVTIVLVNGKLSMVAAINDGDEDTVPGMLAKMMMEHATMVLNSTLGENKVIQKMMTQ